MFTDQISLRTENFRLLIQTLAEGFAHVGVTEHDDSVDARGDGVGQLGYGVVGYLCALTGGVGR
jgi:hypothetical protein